MAQEKDYVYVKSNGIRKELQQTNKHLASIAKSLKKLANKQTSNENYIDYNVASDWTVDSTSERSNGKDKETDL